MPFLKSLLKTQNARHWLSLLTVMAVSVAAVNLQHPELIRTSILDTPDHAPFDGMVMPVQEAPDWTHLNDQSLTYYEVDDELMQAIPYYNTDYIEFDISNLQWGNAQHDVIRNTIISYPVAWAGDYQGGPEGSGSHAGIDIKGLKHTPIYSIANGVVIDAGWRSGFGYTVVVQHKNVPDYDNPSRLTTVYSGYAHLEDIHVSENQVVTKGEIIGSMGTTGTSTTHHLHFQIDKDSAPWHPYWPFSSSEAAAQGYGFFDAVNAGVGMSNLYAHTYNPTDYIYAYSDYEPSQAIEVSEEEDEVEIVVVEEMEEEPLEVEEKDVEEPVVESAVNLVDFSNIELDQDYFVMVGDKKEFTLKLLDESGDYVRNPSFDGRIEMTVSDDSVGKLNRSFLEAVDFNSGEAEITFYGDAEGSLTIEFEISGRRYESAEINVIADIEPFASFGIGTDGNFTPGVAETIYIQALDLAGNPTPGFYRNGTVEIKVIEGDAELSETKLDKNDFPTGVAALTVTGENSDDIVIRVSYGNKETEAELTSQLFTDFASTDTYFAAVQYLYHEGIMTGYPDGSFQANRTISRVEVLKVILKGTGQDENSSTYVSFSDTYRSEWYYGFIAAAYDLGMVEGYPDGSFKPARGVNRVEFLKMLLSHTMDIDPVVTENPYSDVDRVAWYAPYVATAKEYNLFPLTSNQFDPESEVSRLEVAETIYRLNAVLQNDMKPYSIRMNVK